MTTFKKFYLCSVIGVLMASFYPLYMGVRIVKDMVQNGTVLAENYPKYIIPYTPISLAIILAVLILPVLVKYIPKSALPVASLISLAVFFTSELLLENKVIVTSTVTTKLESWQMFMCYVPPENTRTRTWRAVDVLIGEYSPAFKIHFYVISVILILAVLNCFYGFANMIVTKNKSRKKALVIQSISAAMFLGLCILACFTTFFRDGEIIVSAISAIFMSLFFTVFGVTAGVYVSSFLLEKQKKFSILLPSIASSIFTLIMYIGELVLLSGHLYRFGTGFLSDGIAGIVLAPVDILVILVSGIITAVICIALNRKSKAEYVV